MAASKNKIRQGHASLFPSLGQERQQWFVLSSVICPSSLHASSYAKQAFQLSPDRCLFSCVADTILLLCCHSWSQLKLRSPKVKCMPLHWWLKMPCSGSALHWKPKMAGGSKVCESMWCKQQMVTELFTSWRCLHNSISYATIFDETTEYLREWCCPGEIACATNVTLKKNLRFRYNNMKQFTKLHTLRRL